MIGKQIKGKSFRGVLNYLAKKQGSKIIAKNMGGKTPQTLSAEFAASKRLNPRLKKAVYHSSLSLLKTEHLDNRQWSAIASDYLEGMGFSGSQYVAYRHSDRDRDHIHIVASRIRLTDGTTVSDSWDYIRSEKLIRELENKYELIPTISSKQKQKRGQTAGEIKLLERTGKESIRNRLQKIIDEETKFSVTLPELVKRLKKREIDTHLNLIQTDEIQGISYSLDKIAFSGTHLGKAYTFGGLQKYKRVKFQGISNREKTHMANFSSVVNEKQKVYDENLEQLEASQRLQIERGRIIAPILITYLEKIKSHEAVGKHYRISWNPQQQILSLFKIGQDEPKLVVEYKQQQMKIKELPFNYNQPKLNENDLKFFKRVKIELNRQRSISRS